MVSGAVLRRARYSFRTFRTYYFGLSELRNLIVDSSLVLPYVGNSGTSHVPQPMLRCPLCFAISLDKGAQRLYNTVLWESDGYAVVPAVGPLQVGHVMVVSRAHKPSLASLGSRLIREYDVIAKLMRAVHAYAGAVEIEHGAIDRRAAGACIEHAHVHWLPADNGIANRIAEALSTEGSIVSGVEEVARATGEYIFLRGPGGALVYNVKSLPTQFIRQIACRDERPDEWDWAVHPRIEVVNATVNLWKRDITPLLASTQTS
jgi:diadenosine tetraphosphate (Ap4A) HIT family hydrolase